uniref:Uncharacterized protein n=1 Tax=Anopheles coluzzii TaxID=1518534 RepID=A0A8W7PK73_ANOCL
MRFSSPAKDAYVVEGCKHMRIPVPVKSPSSIASARPIAVHATDTGMELDNIYLNKLPIVAATGSEGGTWNHYAFIESTWGERKILLKIIVFSPLYNTPLSFLSEIDHEVLQQTAIRLERPWNDFLHETKLALCTEGGANGFSYAVEENNFVWRKVVGPALTVAYGSVILLRSQCLLSDVLSNSIATQNRLRNDVQLKNKVLHELKEEHEELVELQRQQEEDSRLYEIELITNASAF